MAWSVRACIMRATQSLQEVIKVAHAPTKSKPIFPPSHKAHALPRQVKICTLGPSVAPLCERVCRTRGIWFVTRPRALNGTKRRGSFLRLVGAVSLRTRFRGGGPVVSIGSIAPISYKFLERVCAIGNSFEIQKLYWAWE